jgi:hypothetical protein
MNFATIEITEREIYHFSPLPLCGLRGSKKIDN